MSLAARHRRNNRFAPYDARDEARMRLEKAQFDLLMRPWREPNHADRVELFLDSEKYPKIFDLSYGQAQQAVILLPKFLIWSDANDDKPEIHFGQSPGTWRA